MKITYYGTSAGGGIPEIFCSCRICENARKQKGKDIRTRSQATLDDKISLDYSVDTFLHTVHGGLDMRKIGHILITHAHHDHFMQDDILSRPQGVKEPITFYASALSGESLKEKIDELEDAYNSGRRIRTTDFRVKVETLTPYQPVKILDYTVTPLPANHAPNVGSLIFALQGNGKSVLWGHDTGPLFPEVVDFLKNSGIVFDFVSLDCTLERGKRITKAHMDIDQCRETLDALIENGNATQNTLCAVSHIGHLVALTHDELTELASSMGMIVAYDGMTVEF